MTTAHPSELALFHRNPRKGDVTAIKGSLRANGQYKPVVVNVGTHTKRPMEVLAGNHTVKAIRDLAEEHPDDDRWQQVLIHTVDVDDDRAARIVAADNKIGDLGTYDEHILADLLADLPDLDGTGYVDEDLADLFARFEEFEEDNSDSGNVVDKGLPTQGDYDSTETRMFVLPMGRELYVWAEEMFGKYRQEFKLDTNTDSVLHLLQKWSGETPPAAIG